MNKIVSLITISAVVFASCGENKKASLDACACAQELLKSSGQDSLALVECEKSRLADTRFQADFDLCLLAAKSGVDTSQVKLTRNEKGSELNLPAPAPGSYALEATTSSVRWVAKKVTGQHNGTVAVKSGFISMEQGVITGGEIIIDMNSIVVSDQTGDSKTKLEGHLKSDDFFGVEKFAEAKYTITSVTPETKHKFVAIGNMSIKGKTQSQKVVLTVTPGDENTINVSGGIAVDRTLFDVKYGSGKFFENLGDKAIEDVFMMTFDLKGKK